MLNFINDDPAGEAFRQQSESIARQEESDRRREEQDRQRAVSGAVDAAVQRATKSGATGGDFYGQVASGLSGTRGAGSQILALRQQQQQAVDRDEDRAAKRMDSHIRAVGALKAVASNPLAAKQVAKTLGIEVDDAWLQGEANRARLSGAVETAHKLYRDDPAAAHRFVMGALSTGDMQGALRAAGPGRRKSEVDEAPLSAKQMDMTRRQIMREVQRDPSITPEERAAEIEGRMDELYGDRWRKALGAPVRGEPPPAGLNVETGGVPPRKPEPPGMLSDAWAAVTGGRPQPGGTDPRTSMPPQPSAGGPPVPGARQAPDGNWYVPNPAKPGKYLMVQP